MSTNLIQPKGSVSKETNKQSIARTTGVKQDEVAYLENNLDLSGLKYLYDESTETVWQLTGIESGIVDSWIIQDEIMQLMTNNLTYELYKFNLSWIKDTIVYVSSVSELELIDKIDGTVVKTKSYYVNETKGGGFYVYDSTKSTINDGIYIINGWVRKFVSNIITASDAGIKESLTSSDATTRLNALFAGAYNGVKIDLENVVINLTTHARISNVNNVEIYNFILKGDKSNWTFVNNDRGMLLPSYCNNLELHHGEIVGVRKSQPNTPMSSTITATGRIQDGDAGIEFKYCNDLNIHHTKVHGVKTWGILSTNGNRPSAWKNVVYDCARQSGISLCIGTTNDVTDVDIHDNIIYNIGLYGIEIEKWTKTAKRIHVYDNNISSSQYGIHIVGLVQGANIHNNNIYGCYYAMAGTSVNASLSQEGQSRNYFINNVAYANYAGIAPSNSYYVTYGNNIINGLRDSDYFNSNPYNTVEIVASSTSFYSLRTITVGTVLEINGVLCTVTSSTSNTDETITNAIGLTTVYLITCDVLPAGLEDYTPFKMLATTGTSYGYWAFYQINKNEQIVNNIFENLLYGFYQTAAATENNNCIATGNTLINVTSVASGGAYGIRISKSILQNCSRYTDSLNKISLNLVGLKQLPTVSYTLPITAPATKPTVSFYNYGPDISAKAQLIVNNASWNTTATSVNLALTINGNVVGYYNLTAKGTNVNTTIDYVSNGTLVLGENTVRIVDTSGSLSFDSWYVNIFVAD